MLTHVPLPSWKALFRSFFCRQHSDAALASTWHRDGEVAGWLSRSAWSLALVALWRKRCRSNLSLTVWIPDFFCNTALTALRQTGAKLVFYPVTEKMAPDIAACRELSAGNPPDMFLLVHYFGQPMPAVEARDFCARYGAWLVEDGTHVLRPIRGVGTAGDFVLYSPHKHMPIPDGAVLVVRSDGPTKLDAEQIAFFDSPRTWPGQLRELRERMRHRENDHWIRASVWFFKRVLQKVGVRSRRKPPVFTDPLPLERQGYALLGSPSLGGLARRLLLALLPDIEVVARKRQRHQLVWDGLLLEFPTRGEVTIANRPAGREWTPYLAAYETSPAAAPGDYERWCHQGLPVTTWPDLPPEVHADRERHAKAWELRHSRLYLPVHQSLNVGSLIKAHPRRYREPKVGMTVRMICDQTAKDQWQKWLGRMERSNLLQSWPYGDAKAEFSGWRVRRYVFYCEGEPVAFVQVLQKKVFGLLCVTRVNRGPLFLKFLDDHQRLAVWEALLSWGCVRRGRLLSLAPQFNLSAESLILLERQGARQFSFRSYESAWVNLSLDANTLRKNLDGKWRNMLAFAEKKELKLEIKSDGESFDWMIERYQTLMREKGFSGPPVGLLRSLCRHSAEQPLLVLRALHEGQAVAAICLASHGSAATYLLGWNGVQGRNLKANQFLLWNAILHLKQSGLKWLDLGGISEEFTPGISAFKLGLNGERYELVGDYWKW
jgi:hypothetical protein